MVKPLTTFYIFKNISSSDYLPVMNTKWRWGWIERVGNFSDILVFESQVWKKQVVKISIQTIWISDIV